MRGEDESWQTVLTEAPRGRWCAKFRQTKGKREITVKEDRVEKGGRDKEIRGERVGGARDKRALLVMWWRMVSENIGGMGDAG